MNGRSEIMKNSPQPKTLPTSQIDLLDKPTDYRSFDNLLLTGGRFIVIYRFASWNIAYNNPNIAANMDTSMMETMVIIHPLSSC